MKKTATTLLLLLMAITSKSQTLNYANYSSAIGTTLDAAIGDLASFNMGILSVNGPGSVWNASTISAQAGTPVVQFIFGQPSATPYANLFPQSNYVQYDPALTAFVGYDYLIVTPDSVGKAGSYAPSTEHEIYQDPDRSLIFPFSLGQSFTDTYAKTNYSDATTVSSYQTGTRTVTFSGAGTLILPQGSFSNVGLITSVRTNSLGPNSTNYNWIDLTTGMQLLYYAENDGDQTLAFNPSFTTGITFAPQSINVTVSPNPFTDKSEIKLNKYQPQTYFTLSDMQGREIRKSLFESPTMSVSREGMASGCYNYTISDDNGILSRGKLIIQ